APVRVVVPPPGALPLWPPLLATRGPGGATGRHAHHAMHIVMAFDGTLRTDWGEGVRQAAGVVTAPDVPHAIDGRGVEVLLVFLDPESDAGAALFERIGGAARCLDADERDALAPRSADPMRLMQGDGVAWTRHAVGVLGGRRNGSEPARRRVHPRVRRLLRHLRTLSVNADASLESLASVAGVSRGRLMHAFTESIGIPLRPYLAWLKLQRAAAGVAAGKPFAQVAVGAGFADAAHMTRAFRRMFGTTPSALRPRAPSR
ncbi:MAG TPA: helix-turn-helix transcriptional regulator, partial [Polyangiaceae bacterium]